VNWENLTVLVTGGNGFIGLNLVHRLISLNTGKIRVVDNLGRESENRLAGLPYSVEFINGNLCDKNVCKTVCEGVDVVFHLASVAGSMQYYLENEFAVFSHNTQLDQNMIDSALKQNVQFFIYISSAFIYPCHLMQNPQSKGIKEDEAYPAQPAISYGWAKLMGETALEYALSSQTEMRGAIFRLANVFGPHQNLDLKRGSIIPVLIRRAIEFEQNSTFMIFGEGHETRTYIYITDVLDAFFAVFEVNENKKNVGPINIGGEMPIRMKDLAMMIIQLSEKNITLQHISAPPPTTMSQTLDISRATRELNGWHPKISLKEGLEKMYAFVENYLKGARI